MLRSLFDTPLWILTHPIGRKRPVRCLTDWVRWQLSSRLLGSPIAVQLPAGVRVLASRGMTGITGSIYTGLHDFEDMAFLLHFLRAGDLFVDVGANVGSYCLFGACVGADVIAFEPGPAAVQYLRENVQLNGVSNRVTVYEKALGAHPARVGFVSDQDTTNRVASNGDISVEMVTADTMLPRTATLAKLDVEGTEHDVLAGGRATLLGAEAIILETNGEATRAHQMLSDAGFQPHRYDPERRSLTELPAQRADSNNTLYLKSRAEAAHRVRHGARFEVKGLEF